MTNLAKIEFLRMGRNKKYLIMSIGMPVFFFLSIYGNDKITKS